MIDIVMVGSGGCMRELVWQILEANRNLYRWHITGYVDNEPATEKKGIIVGGYNIPYLGDDDYLLNLQKDINVVVSIGNSKLRKRIVDKYTTNNHIHFPNIILNSAYVCSDIEIGYGCIIAMGVKVSTKVTIGNFVFMNTESMVCHDGRIENFVTFSPKAQAAGAVTVGENSEIGMNATIIQCLNIGKNVTIGAGAVVTKNVEDNCTVVGVPARKVERKNECSDYCRSRN